MEEKLVLEMESINRRDTRRNRGRRVGVVYADSERPFNKGDILGDLVWRREHGRPFKNNEIMEAIAEVITKYKITNVKLSYSRYAGCKCPCSPGYVMWGDTTEIPQWKELSAHVAYPSQIAERKRREAEYKAKKDEEAKAAAADKVMGAGI